MVRLVDLVSAALFPVSIIAQSTTYVNPAVPTGTLIPGTYTGPLRPQVHFSPPKGFMNDPNGMFMDANGTWHLYYQYNPTGVVAVCIPNSFSVIISSSAIMLLHNPKLPKSPISTIIKEVINYSLIFNHRETNIGAMRQARTYTTG